jgi:hypothetical protein
MLASLEIKNCLIVLIAQRIERRFPEPKIEVRFLLGTQEML